jgi:uncharacterized membrane protein
MREVYLASVVLHVLAAMTWIGGMVVFVAAFMPLLRKQDEAVRGAMLNGFGLRFRTVSGACFAILIVTGAFNLWMRGVQTSDFLRAEWRSTSFGRLVLLKLSLVLVAIILSSMHERAESAWQARWSGRALLVAGVAIVAVAVALVRAL